MKKIIILLFSVGAITTSFAQYNDPYGNANWNPANAQYASNVQYGYGNHFSARDRDFQIAKINQDFNFKVQSIENDYYMRHYQKRAAIRNAEYERARQIHIVNARFHRDYHYGY